MGVRREVFVFNSGCRVEEGKFGWSRWRLFKIEDSIKDSKVEGWKEMLFLRYGWKF